MFYNFADTQIPFEEFKLDNQKLTEYRQRLLAVDPGLYIEKEQVDLEPDEDDFDLYNLYIISQDPGKVVILAAASLSVCFPGMYILSDAGDCKMTDTEMFDALTQMYENQPERKLTNLIYDKEELELAFTIEHICAYLEDFRDNPTEQDHLFFTSRSFYDTEGEPMHLHFAVDPNEVLRLLRILLATIYNYHEPYKFTKDDLFWL